MGAIDAGQRCADAVNTAVMTGGIGRYIAVKLSDGSTNGALYDTKPQAWKHARVDMKLLHENQAVYIKVPPDGMTPSDAVRFMEINQKLYENGMRLAAPEQELIMPHLREDIPDMFRRRNR